MAKDGFSLGHEGLLADTAERYWREKVSKAKAKAKTKRKVEAPPAGCAQSVHHSKGRQVEGLRSEELDEAEQELLGPATHEKLSSATARNSRRKHVDEVDESRWKLATRSREHHLSLLLAAQEQLLQRSCLCEPTKPFLAAEAKGMNLMDENAARRRPGGACNGASDRQCSTWERTSDLTLTLTGDFVDELARGYSQPWFQDLVRQCIEESGDQQTLLERLHDVAFEVQKPVLENWGFEGNDQGLFDMTSILREHSAHGPLWLQEKIFSCLRLLLPCQEESAIGTQRADVKKTFVTISNAGISKATFLVQVESALDTQLREVLSEAIGQIARHFRYSIAPLARQVQVLWLVLKQMHSCRSSECFAVSVLCIPCQGRTADEVAAFMSSLPDGAGMESVAEELQEQLQAEQARRQGRCEALRALRVALLKLPSEAVQEKSFADEAAGARAEAAARVSAAKRALEALKENHHQLQEKLEAQLDQRGQLEAAAAAAQSAVERQAQLAASASREWARDGPETDALKASKIELAELLGEVDEARLHRRRELKALQQALEALERENEWLRTGGHDRYEAPGSFAASLKRLFRVAIGKEDPSEALQTGSASQ
ncbi:TATDN1 [Symbiodinium sp. KB8]|nr:TATDN1 [Symbiodinium sp. KB8]